MSKIYLVIEFGGDYEDSWEIIRIACKSKESAINVKKLIEEEHTPPEHIDADSWDKMMDSIWEEIDDDRDLLDFLLSKFSCKYSAEEISKAYSYYETNYDWTGVYIKEINLID